MPAPPDQTADFSEADVVWVSLWSLSVKLSVPVSVWSAPEPVVLAVSVKLTF
jgi:hypothetical protein